MNGLITDTEALDALATDWWDLWHRCPRATPFQTPAWLTAWWRHFAPGTLRVGVVRRDGRLVALAPCYVEHGSHGTRILPLGMSISDHLDVLLDPDITPGEATQLVGLMLDGSGCDRWDLEECSPTAMALTLLPPRGWDAREDFQCACPVLDLSAGGGDWLHALPARRRHQYRRAQTLAAKRGAVVINEIAANDAGGFLDDLARLHAARWATRDEPGVLGDPRVQAFQRQVTPVLVAHGLARLFRLTIGDGVAGCYYGFRDAHTGYAYLGGFDPAFSYESPGALLLGHAIADAMQAGATSFDFLRGQESYKYGWGAVDRWNRKRSFVRRAS